MASVNRSFSNVDFPVWRAPNKNMASSNLFSMSIILLYILRILSEYQECYFGIFENIRSLYFANIPLFS